MTTSPLKRGFAQQQHITYMVLSVTKAIIRIPTDRVTRNVLFYLFMFIVHT